MSCVFALTVVAVSLVAAEPATAQPGCYDTGHSVRCRPGCQPLSLPRFAGDFFTWRCRRRAPPPPPRYYSAPPPPASCPPGMYPATETWCCPFGSIYRNGECRFPQEQRTYRASGSDDPTPVLIILGVIGLGILAWYDHHARQVAFARETADAFDDINDIDAATRRVQAAADEADEILRRFRNKTSGDS